MPKLPLARTGTAVAVRGRPVAYNFWPVAPWVKKYRVQDVVFTTEPWSAMRGALSRNLKGPSLQEATSYLDQAQDLLEAATGRRAATPVLLYYSMLNVAKALVLSKGKVSAMADAIHGLSVDLLGTPAPPAAKRQDDDLRLVVQTAGTGKLSVYSELLKACALTPPGATTYRLIELAPQVVIGHRLWRQSSGSAERFLPIQAIRFVKGSRQLWLELEINRADLSRYSLSGSNVLTKAGLLGKFIEVRAPAAGPRIFEGMTLLPFTAEPGSVMLTAAQGLKRSLWRTYSGIPPYRGNYLHLADGTPIFPQLGSMYGILFLLGYLNRYRPGRLEQLLDGPNGAFFNEFLASQPEQLLYAFASEMNQREVIRAL